MKYSEIYPIALAIQRILEPYCIRCEIAGSIRRKKLDCGDIEIVAIPKPYDVGLFASGIALIVDNWEKVKGELPCKYTQRLLPGKIKLDLFFATPENWGLIFAIRTGSAEFSHNFLAAGWVRNGFKSVDGMLRNKKGDTIPVQTEQELFKLCGLQWVEPEKRI